jgi:hypothetical protein
VYANAESNYLSDVSWTFNRSYDSQENICILRDTVTKRSYRLSYTRGNRGTALTNMLLKRLRDRTGSNVIGYRIVPTNRNQLLRHVNSYIEWDYATADEMVQELRKERFTTIPNSGYSKFFALAGGKLLKSSNGEISVAEDASKGQIRTAFKKANKGRKESRVMLSQFIDMIA